MFRRWRRTFWRWHRRVGISALVFLALMALTGIILNHADDWRLYEARLPYWLADWAYGDLSTRQIRSLRLDDNQIEQLGDDLIVNQQLLNVGCSSEINGLAFADDLYWIGCGTNLIAATESGQFVEQVSSPFSSVEAIANCDQSICLLSESVWMTLDLMTLESSPANQKPKPIVPTISESHLKITPAEFNIGRLIADVHSGAIFRTPGKLAVDLLGVIVLFLAVSGCYLWMGNRRKPSRS